VLAVELARKEEENDADSSVVEVESSVDGAVWPGIDPNVQTHSRRLFLRPATGVSGQESPSESEDESRLSPALG
jgi:hypothetical protein